MKGFMKWPISILLFCGLPVLIGVWFLWHSFSQNHEDIVAAAEQRAKLLSIVEFGQGLKDTGAQQIAFSQHLIGTEDTPSLRAELQARVKDMAAQRGLQVFQAAEEAGQDIAPALKSVRLRLEVAGVWSSALQFLQDIEAQEKWLFVDNLTMRSSEQEGVAPSGEPQVQMSILLSGLVQLGTTGP